MPPPEPVMVFSVDDEHFTVPLFLVYELDNRFPGAMYRRSDNMDDAVAHAKTSMQPTIYILDSRAPLPHRLAEECTSAIRARHNIDIQQQFGIQPRMLLTGVYVGALLRILRQDCRVVLLTAYYNEIHRIPNILPLLDVACDAIIPKIDGKGLEQVIERILARQAEKSGC